ncbi:hypothetical protein B0T17DRAFT_372787 [Bombardia bombarda]|uniref:Uncharacterized protein n=1 Tax=Bombardia bombarda TaxID=252184 RepID=A0AA40BVB9_9PEZI|nr:hypothetical protein B0T17DRAFT_372787 [Bombardia bombarda]
MSSPSPQGATHQKASKLRRLLIALPLLGITILAKQTLNPASWIPTAIDVLKSGSVHFDGTSMKLWHTFYHITKLDEIISLLNVFFMPSVYGFDPVSRVQMISFLSDGGVLLNIWLLESVRRGNASTIMQLPILFTLAGQIVGLGVLAPFYFFLHYILSPIGNFQVTGQRLTRMHYTAAVLPAVVIGYYVPFYSLYFWPELGTRQGWLFLWQLYPITTSISFLAISRLFADTAARDSLHAPKRDLPLIRAYVGTAVTLAAGAWVWAWFWSLTEGGASMAAIFIPTASPQSTSVASLTRFNELFLQYDHIFVIGTALVWQAYLFGDLKAAGAVQVSWPSLFLRGAASLLVLGPGATLGLGWLWREHVVASRAVNSAAAKKR